MSLFQRVVVIALLAGLSLYFAVPASAISLRAGLPGSQLKADEHSDEETSTEEEDEGEVGNIDPDDADEDEAEGEAE